MTARSPARASGPEVGAGSDHHDSKRASTSVHGKMHRRISPGYLFIAPAILFLAVVALYPAGYVAYLSVFDAGGKFVGLSNYVGVLTSPTFGKVFWQTVAYALGATTAHLVLGFGLALIIEYLPLSDRFAKTSRTLLLIPWALSPAVVAVIGQLWLQPQIGPVAQGLRMMNISTYFGPLGDTSLALLAVTATNVWMFTPFYMLMLLAGLKGVDREILEAALMDGATGRQQVRFITIPTLKNLILTLAVFDFTTTAAYFDITWLMTQGGPVSSTEIFPTWAYRSAFQNFNFGEAAAIGYLLFGFSIAFAIATVVAMDKE